LWHDVEFSVSLDVFDKVVLYQLKKLSGSIRWSFPAMPSLSIKGDAASPMISASASAWISALFIPASLAHWYKQEFGSVQLHVEWRIPAGRKVNGQKGGNSGIFLMDRYEIQVQESHTNVTYADGQAAALYGQTPLMVNASAPQGEWQSYDIVFEAPIYDPSGMKEPARVTVIHNGVLVHHRQKYYGPTKHKKAATYPKNHPEKAPIRFQWHGDPIEFRNVWVREL